MIFKEDSPERRELSQDLFQVMAGLVDLSDLNHEFRKYGMEARRQDLGGWTYFRIFTVKGRKQIDTFVFSTGDDVPDTDPFAADKI